MRKLLNIVPVPAIAIIALVLLASCGESGTPADPDASKNDATKSVAKSPETNTQKNTAKAAAKKEAAAPAPILTYFTIPG